MSSLSPEERSKKKEIIDSHLELLGDAARMLCSYPRSGSFWLRSMLYDDNTLLHGRHFWPTRPFFLKPLSRFSGSRLSSSRPPWLACFSPQIELPNFAAHFKAGRPDQRIIKTHLPIDSWESYASNKQILVLFRSPADCIVSAFKKRSAAAYRKNATGRRKFASKSHASDLIDMGIDAFASRQVTKWLKHANSFVEYDRLHPGRLKFLSYERLKKETQKCLSEVLTHYGLPVDQDRIAAVVRNRDISTVKKNVGTPREDININRGKIGEAKNLLAPATLEKIENDTRAVLDHMIRLERQLV